MSRSSLLVPAGKHDPCNTGWPQRHNDAVMVPRGFESPLVAMFGALEAYARLHKARFESTIGEDGVLGPAWLDMARGLRTLLNGQSGRLDCGTLDSAILDLIMSNGFTDGDL